MTERFKLSLSGMWLLASLTSMILPVFVPSHNSLNPVENTIGAATAAMFILSFPSSLFGLPLLFLVNFGLQIDMGSIGGMYVNLLLLFVLGLVQWFWVVPRMFRTDPALQTLHMSDSAPDVRLPEFRETADCPIYDADGRTPIERVLRDDEIK